MRDDLDGPRLSRTADPARFDGREHQAALDFPGAVDRTGSTEKLLVHGDSAQGHSGRYFGLIVAGFGVLLAIAGLLLRRS